MRVCIAGAGDIALFHLKFLQQIPAAEVVGICDRNAARAGALAARFGIASVYEDYEAMLHGARPEVVHVLVPPRLHAAFCIAAMNHGAHVLVEKPMALEHDDARRMARVSEETGRRLAVCEMYRFDPTVVKARALIQQGAIGRVLHVEGYWFADVRGDTNAYSMRGQGDGWAYDLPGGVFANFLDHPVYLQTEFLGPIRSLQVSSATRGENPFVPIDELRVHVQAESGITGVLAASLNAKPRVNLLRLYGTEGILTVDISNMSVTIVRNRRLPGFLSKGMVNVTQSLQLLRDTVTTTARVATGRIVAREGLRSLLKEYYGTLGHGPTSPLDARHALETNTVLSRIWECVAQSDAGQATGPAPRYRFARQYPVVAEHPRVLVTGASGFVGRRLVEALLQRDYVVRIITRWREGCWAADPRVEVVYGDIRNPDCVDAAVQGTEAVYHCAAKVTNKGSWETFREANVDSTARLLEASVRHGVGRFVFVSSVAVYGFNARPGKRPLVEEDGYGQYYSPYCFYARSKAEAERLVQACHREKGLATVIVRPGMIFGPGGKDLLRSAPVLFAAKRRVLPYVYVDDVVSALLAAGQSPAAAGKIYNVVGDQSLTQGQFRKAVQRVAGRKRLGIHVPLWAMHLLALTLEKLAQRKKSAAPPPFGLYHYRSLVRNLRYDNSRIKADLGWAPRVSIEEGIRRTLEAGRGTPRPAAEQGLDPPPTPSASDSAPLADEPQVAGGSLLGAARS